MDEVWHRRDLIAPARLMELNGRSDLKGAARLATHVTVLSLTALFVSRSFERPWLIAALFLHGAAVISLFAPFHEAVHATAFRTKRVNTVLARLCGVILFLPATFYRQIHFHHHRHTQALDQDPELIVRKPETFREYILYVWGVPFLLFLMMLIVLQSMGIAIKQSDAIPTDAWPRVTREARFHLGVYAAIVAASIYFGWAAAVFYWLVPLAMTESLLCIFLLAEHTGCPHTPDLLQNTRTTRTNPVVRLLMWNMPFHAEHHLFPSVPFHALPALHRELAGKFRHVESGYMTFHKSFLKRLHS